MSKGAARWVAWSVVGLYFAMVTAGIFLQAQTGETFLGLGFPIIVTMTIFIISWPILGAVIVSRYPRQPIGWILCLTLLVWAKDNFTFGYATYGLTLGVGSLPALNLALVLSTWDGNSFGLFAFTLLLLLFPTGRPISPRWKRVAWAAFGGLVAYLALSLFAPSDSLIVGLPNPLSVNRSVWALLGPLRSISLSIVALALLLAAVSSILRLRRSRGDERQQLKWIIYAGALFPASIPFASYATLVGLVGSWLKIGMILQAAIVAAVGIATAVAILKYRLYDIDIIINKTLVYGALSAALALIYFVSVVLLQEILPADSPIAIVLSTLAVAALFSPLRRRIQEAIDRRFYRRKYDAQRILAAFSARMRDEVELKRLSETLLAVVDESLQPTQLSLWLREIDR